MRISRAADLQLRHAIFRSSLIEIVLSLYLRSTQDELKTIIGRTQRIFLVCDRKVLDRLMVVAAFRGVIVPCIKVYSIRLTLVADTAISLSVRSIKVLLKLLNIVLHTVGIGELEVFLLASSNPLTLVLD